MRLHSIIFALPLAFSPGLAAQSVPTTINYQGRLTDNTPAQNPVNATVPMAFALWDAASAGNKLWQEPASGGTSVLVVNGIFNVALGGNGVAIASTVFTGATSTRYLEITMNPGTPGAETLAPRQLITASGYANLAQSAGSAASFTGPLAGNVTGTQAATVVAIVGGQTAANVAAGSVLANGATNLNTANALVKRDASGGFSAGAVGATSLNSSGNLTLTRDAPNTTLRGMRLSTEYAAVTDSYNVPSSDATTPLTPAASSLCYLTEVRLDGASAGFDFNSCIVAINGANWELRSHSASTNNEERYTECHARCLEWNW